MKKLFAVLGICLLLAFIPGMSAGLTDRTECVPLDYSVFETSVEQTEVDWTGEFAGAFGPNLPGDDWVTLGTMAGYYKINVGPRERLTAFVGQWILEDETAEGSIRGIFGRHIMLGKVTIYQDGQDINLPYLGFIKVQDDNVLGRMMAPVGPALYFAAAYSSY
jgi:hypothetical protein